MINFSIMQEQQSDVNASINLMEVVKSASAGKPILLIRLSNSLKHFAWNYENVPTRKNEKRRVKRVMVLLDQFSC